MAANLRAIEIWIGTAADLGLCLGTEMMRLVLARCLEDSKVTAVLVNPPASNTRPRRFYERCGFRAVERRHFVVEEHAMGKAALPTAQATE